MTLELIMQIKKAEEEAANLVSESVTSAREIIADAQRKKDEIISQAYEDASKEADDISRKAAQESKLNSGIILEKARDEGIALKEKTSSKIDKTVQKVIERIVANGSS